MDFGGILKEVSLAFVPEAAVGDYVIVHVGFALSRLDEAEANQVFQYLREMEELSQLEGAAPSRNSVGTRSRVDQPTAPPAPETAQAPGGPP